ncbi:hypothetical protein Aazo_1146 ['Nostoc azollae' 0708]|jgi:hypothetical protein|uniref:Uncharacterized protein n=1 Tax=Nostoc azollae (strain 0708) TaxID=551115 RepID=D7E2U7_NOSA0|nr:hypothetical protein Aazo_1146 ['Nostoc azollae' 0708]
MSQYYSVKMLKPWRSLLIHATCLMPGDPSTAVATFEKGEIKPFLASLFKGGWGDQKLTKQY